MQLDYYVYGDFQSVVNAFHMVANLFSNHTYQSWFTVVMLLTIAAFAFQAAAERIFGAKASDAIWIKRVMIGTVLYSIFMVPTITLHIYDPFKNKYEAVGGIPAGVGLIAGMTSGFTREISELIETAGSPIIHIDDIGFGNGYEMLSATSALGSIGLSQDQYLTRTLSDYFDKCIIQMNASGDLDFDALWNGNGKTILENIATDYRIFSSTVWTSANPGGVLFQCADAYQHIVTQLTQPARVDKAFRVFCSKVNYNPTDATEFMMCRQKFRGVYEAFSTPEGFGYNETSLFASAVVAEMYLTDGINAGVERAKEIARSMATASDAVSGAMAADFMPMIQGMVATILISLFVIVALLMYVAPMDAFKFYFGLWIWFLTWVLVDVVINIQVQNYAYEVFREIRETGLSLTTMFSIGDRSAQVLGWYGKARWMSMTIASMMTYGIFKFGGGAAFASFAGALGASYSGQAASQGAQVGAPGGEAAQYKKGLDDLSMVPATTMASFDGGSSMRALQNANKAYLSKQITHGAGISNEAASRGMSTWEFGGAQGENQAMQDGAGVSQYQRYQDEGITSSQIGNMNAYNSIRGVNKVEALEANGIDAATGGQADGHKDAGSVKGEQMGEAFEKEHGMGYGELAAKGGFHRLLKSSTEYKTANDNGWETITTDFNGNVIGREGYYAKMNVDTDGDGVGMEMTNVRYNSATGELTGIYNGKTYTMKGNFLDADGSDGTLSIDPAMTTVRSGSDIQKLDRDLETTEKGTTGAFHDEHTVNIDGQTRIMSGSIQQSGNSFYGKNLIDKETGMSYSIEATGERGADGSFNLKSAVIEGKGTMDTLTTSDGTVLKSARVNAYGSNFDDMRMVIEGTTTENGKAMDVSAKAQGRIEDGQILGEFSVLDKKASETTTDVNKSVYDHQNEFKTGSKKEHAETVAIAGAATGNADPRLFTELAGEKSATGKMHESLVLGSAYGDNYKGYSHSDSISRSSALAFIGSLGMDVGASAGGKSGNMFSDFFNSAGSNSANPVNDAYGYNPEIPAPQTPKGGVNINGGVSAKGDIQHRDETKKSQQEQYDVVRMSYAYAAYDAANQADKLGITDESERAFFIKGRMDEFDTKFREEFTGVKDPREVPTEMPDMPSGNANPRIHDTKPEDIYDASTSGKYYEHKDKKD